MTTNNVHSQTAAAFRSRIKAYDSESIWQYTFQAKAVLDRLDQALVRLYDANCLSLSDFKRFDDMILSRQIKIKA